MLRKESFKAYIHRFNLEDEESIVHQVGNCSSWAWLSKEIPFFECADKRIEEVYYYRWWSFRKHLKKTDEGFVFTEFLPEVSWSGKYNTISASSMHHVYEGRWLKNSSSYIGDYCRFWFTPGAKPRLYSGWMADAVWRYGEASGNFELAIELFDSLKQNFYEWEKSNRHESGLFWSNDDRDGMECSISGPGLRPTLNSYLYGDAAAIAAIAQLYGSEGDFLAFTHRKQQLRSLILDRLWDKQAEFFKTIPLQSVNEPLENKNIACIPKERNACEQLGYIPWYFNLPGEEYENAWRKVTSSDGFLAPFGLTTAETVHDGFMVENMHECLWNGPVWPFATSQTLTAMANLLNNSTQIVVGADDYWRLLLEYADCHKRVGEDGKPVFWLDENLHPYTGIWLAREKLKQQGWPSGKGGYERGKNYNHSTFCDLVITGLAGLRPRRDDLLEINPLLPSEGVDYFCLDYVRYHGHDITIIYDRTGEKYGFGEGLVVFVDNKEVAKEPVLGRILVSLA